jgi:hypothetical protein
VHRSNFTQFVSKTALRLKKIGQNEILQKAQCGGNFGPRRAVAPDVPDLIALSAAKRPDPG